MKYGLDDGGHTDGSDERHDAGSASAVAGASHAAAATDAPAIAVRKEEPKALERGFFIRSLLLLTSSGLP
jgi:hypothetical protein